VIVVEESISLDDIKAGNVDVIINNIIDAAGNFAKTMALFRARQALEPKLEANGLLWDDVLELANFVTLKDLELGITNPEALLERLLEISGPLAKKTVLYRLKDALNPLLQKIGLALQDKMPSMSYKLSVPISSSSLPSGSGSLSTPAVDMSVSTDAAQGATLTIGEMIINTITLNDLKQAVATQEVQPIVDKLLAASADLAKQVAINLARGALEPKLVEQGLAWEEAESVMYLIEINDLKSGQPMTIFNTILDKSVSLAKKVALFQVKSAIEPKLVQLGLAFEDAVNVVYLITVGTLGIP
jgi:hypothetical protein